MPSSHLIDPRQNDRFGYCEDPTRALTSELPPITDMVRPGGNAFRLPGAAKSLSVFEKKSQMARRVFSRRVLRDVRDGRWSEGRGHTDGRGCIRTESLRTQVSVAGKRNFLRRVSPVVGYDREGASTPKENRSRA